MSSPVVGLQVSPSVDRSIGIGVTSAPVVPVDSEDSALRYDAVEVGSGLGSSAPDGDTQVCTPCAGEEACCDCIDNDADGFTDYGGGDLGCTDASDDTEYSRTTVS